MPPRLISSIHNIRSAAEATRQQNVATEQRAAWLPIVLLVSGLQHMVRAAQREGGLLGMQCHLPKAFVKVRMGEGGLNRVDWGRFD